MIGSLISKLQTLAAYPVVERAFKTFVEATATQAAIYTTITPNTPGVKIAGAVSLGATALSIVWNGLVLWATKAKSAKLDQLAAAIDKIVDARLAEQHAPDPPQNFAGPVTLTKLGVPNA